MKRAHRQHPTSEIPTPVEQEARAVAAMVRDIEDLELIEDRQFRQMQFAAIQIERERLHQQDRERAPCTVGASCGCGSERRRNPRWALPLCRCYTDDMDDKAERAISWIRSVEKGEARVASYRGPWAPLMDAVASGVCRDPDVMEAIIVACAARAGGIPRAVLVLPAQFS